MKVQPFELFFSILKQVVDNMFGMNENMSQTVILAVLVVACITYSVLCGMLFQTGRNLWASFMVLISIGSVICVLTRNGMESLFFTLFAFGLFVVSIFPMLLADLFVWLLYNWGEDVMLMKLVFEVVLVIGMVLEMLVIYQYLRKKTDERVTCLQSLFNLFRWVR